MDVAARAELRQDEAQPLLQSLHDWLLKTRVTVANGGGTAKAMDYSLRRWAALSLYTTDGRLPIDNNPVENVIRPIAIGKKIGYLLDRNVQGNGRRRFRVCWRPRSSTGLILPPGCVKRWRGCRLASTVRSIRCCRSARNQSNKCRGGGALRAYRRPEVSRPGYQTDGSGGPRRQQDHRARTGFAGRGARARQRHNAVTVPPSLTESQRAYPSRSVVRHYE